MAKDSNYSSLQVPTLNVDGTNWLYYKAQVEWAVGSKGLTGHLSGLVPKPEDPAHRKDSSWKPTTIKQKLITVEYGKMHIHGTSETFMHCVNYAEMNVTYL